MHEERLHHPVLTNENARVLDIIAQPGDTSLVHQHSNNYCYVTISGGTIWNEVQGSVGRTVDLKSGFIGGYFENPKKAHIHRFANRSTDVIRLIAVENLSKIGSPGDSLIHLQSNEIVIINNPYFLVTKIPISPNEHLDFVTKYSGVVINLEPSPLELIINADKTDFDQWAWMDANQKISVINPLAKAASVVVVRLKRPTRK